MATSLKHTTNPPLLSVLYTVISLPTYYMYNNSRHLVHEWYIYRICTEGELAYYFFRSILQDTHAAQNILVYINHLLQYHPKSTHTHKIYKWKSLVVTKYKRAFVFYSNITFIHIIFTQIYHPPIHIISTLYVYIHKSMVLCFFEQASIPINLR